MESSGSRQSYYIIQVSDVGGIERTVKRVLCPVPIELQPQIVEPMSGAIVQLGGGVLLVVAAVHPVAVITVIGTAHSEASEITAPMKRTPCGLYSGCSSAWNSHQRGQECTHHYSADEHASCRSHCLICLLPRVTFPKCHPAFPVALSKVSVRRWGRRPRGWRMRPDHL